MHKQLSGECELEMLKLRRDVARIMDGRTLLASIGEGEIPRQLRKAKFNLARGHVGPWTVILPPEGGDSLIKA